jgi:hypothetical protein
VHASQRRPNRARHPKKVLAPRQAHYGYLRYLESLRVRFAQRPAWRVLSPIDEVKRCFDKNACATLLESLDVSITEGVPAPSTHAGCRTLMAQRGWRSSFLKLSCGSSASCLALLRGTPERPVVFTMLKRDNGRWFNSLTIQRLDNPNVIEEVPRFLFGEGSRLEREHPKAPHDGRYVDLRVLCIAGEPRFFVLRQSTHTITNLISVAAEASSRAFVHTSQKKRGPRWKRPAAQWPVQGAASISPSTLSSSQTVGPTTFRTTRRR